MSLSMPTTVSPSPAKWRTASDPMRPAEPVTSAMLTMSTLCSRTGGRKRSGPRTRPQLTRSDPRPRLPDGSVVPVLNVGGLCATKLTSLATHRAEPDLADAETASEFGVGDARVHRLDLGRQVGGLGDG